MYFFSQVLAQYLGRWPEAPDNVPRSRPSVPERLPNEERNVAAMACVSIDAASRRSPSERVTRARVRRSRHTVPSTRSYHHSAPPTPPGNKTQPVYYLAIKVVVLLDVETLLSGFRQCLQFQL